MSKLYREFVQDDIPVMTSPDMRLFCSRPGRRDVDGKPLYFTEQAHKESCDINNIIRKFDRTGLISHINKFEASFGDLTGLDFKKAQDLIISAQKQFDQLPSNIRKRFANSPRHLLAFMEDANNRDEAIRLGLISDKTPADQDGFGEHVKAPPADK